MRVLLRLAAGAAAAFAATAASAATIVGVTVDPNNGNAVVGETEARAALGGQTAVRYFIPLGGPNASTCVYGVDALPDGSGGVCGLDSDSGNGGPTLQMYLLFEPINVGAEYALDILFEDLDLAGANDPTGFLESIDVLSADGTTSLSGGPITDIASLLVAGNADTQQLLTLALGVVGSNPFLIRLDFAASFISKGKNTPEFLIATITEAPLPAALPLVLAGLAGFGFAARGKKR